MRLPFEAVPGKLDADVLVRLGITAGPIMGMAAIVSFFIYSRYDLKRERHQEILEIVAARKAQQHSTGPATE